VEASEVTCGGLDPPLSENGLILPQRDADVLAAWPPRWIHKLDRITTQSCILPPDSTITVFNNGADLSSLLSITVVVAPGHD
jgi:hypothetical protein